MNEKNNNSAAVINPYNAEILCVCYGSTAIINNLILLVRGSFLDVHRSQILMSNDWKG